MVSSVSVGSPALLLVPTELEARRLADQGGFEVGHGMLRVCGFGPVAAAARTAQLLGVLRPSRVLLIGIAGSFREERHAPGTALCFTHVALEGVGVGEGADFRGPPALGFPQWPGSPDVPAIGEELALAAPADREPALLLTTCAASGSPEHAAQRLGRFPAAVAEDMEAFGVALACALFRTPLAVVRGLSNAVGERSAERWRIPAALAAARREALALLEREWVTR